MTSAPNHDRVRAHRRPGGQAEACALGATFPFDGSESMGDAPPGPAHLLASTLAACVLENVERFSHLLPFRHERATVEVTLERQDRPPRIVAASYRLVVDTDEPPRRCALLHEHPQVRHRLEHPRACELSGTLAIRRSSGELIEETSSQEP